MSSLTADMHNRLTQIDRRFVRLGIIAASAYLGRIGTLVVTLVTLPIARHTLSADDFGLWMMISSLLGFLSFADLGIGNGVLNGTIAANAKHDQQALRKLLVAGYHCTLLIAVLLGAAGWAFADHALIALGLSHPSAPADLSGAIDSLRIFIVLMALNIPASLAQKAQLGMQQGHWIGASQLLTALISTTLIVLMPRMYITVPNLICATLGVQLITNIVVTFVWLNQHMPTPLFEQPQRIDWTTHKNILATGALFLLLQISMALAYQSDGIVITRTLGLSAYGDFALTQRLYLVISIFLSATLLGLWPTFGDSLARRDYPWARRLLTRTALGAASFAATAAVILSLSMHWICQHWLNGSLTPSVGLLVALSAWTVLEAVGTIASAFLNSANLLRPQIVIALAMAGSAFALKWIATPLFGPAGAVWATFLSYLLIAVPATLVILQRYFHTASTP
jgi:O-antigen/teichoic acid export membrane protein